MAGWICPECGREWAHHEPCCWVCEQGDPPLGGLCAIAPPPLRRGTVSAVAHAGMPALKQRRREPLIGNHLLDIDREERQVFAASLCAQPSQPEPATEVIEPEPAPAPDANPAIAPDEEVTALVPDDSPPRIFPPWFVSAVLMVALIAGLSLLTYLLFRVR